MMRLVKAIGLAALLGGASGCFYTRTSVNLRDFAERGVSLRPVERKSEGVEPFGRVRATQRTYLFGSCEQAAHGALEKLLGNARKLGANRVGNLRFRARWRSITSVTVSGEAVYDPALASAD
jgi:hypothetical protein